jgi:AAA domain
VEQVEVAAREGQQLAPSHAAERCEQDEHAELRLHRAGEFVDLSQGGQRTFAGRLDAGALDRARVDDDEAVFDRGVQDRPQQPVALRYRRAARPVGEQAGMPAPDAGGGQAAEGERAESRQDVQAEEALVQLPRLRTQPLAARRQPGVEPLPRVVVEGDPPLLRRHPGALLLIGHRRREGALGLGLGLEAPEAHPTTGARIVQPYAPPAARQAVDVSQHWRLVLVGDPRQLQAVGRGGMFDELCRTGRAHELATIHRFRHRWEQRASLLLRAGNAEALDAYFAHGRVAAGTFDDLVADAARQWIDHTDAGRTVALIAETNEHVDALNLAVQQQRRLRGDLGASVTRVAGGETASPGDIIVTRRNDRTARTDRGEPVRNRDRWTVAAVGTDGSLTVSHLNGHGTVTLSADYARQHVRLGYAATAHGHQADTVDVGIAVVTEATSHRTLYVAATRGRQANRLLVVAGDTDHAAARDVLERVLTNDRADVPAVVQRRNLSRQVPRLRAEDAVEAARRALDDARHEAEPFLAPLRAAEAAVRAAEQALRKQLAARDAAPRWRRRGMAPGIERASDALASAQSRLDSAEHAASPHRARIHAAEQTLHEAEREASRARLVERLDRLTLEPPARVIDRGVGIEPPGLGL